MKLPLTGSCLCGAVNITVTAPPLLTLACHCRDCQKISAGAFTMTTMVPAEAFHCDGALEIGGLHTPGRTHYFCASCKNVIYSKVAEDRINLRTSLLDNAEAFAPFVELMTSEKLPWASTPAPHSYDSYPQVPDEFLTLLEAYARWRDTP